MSVEGGEPVETRVFVVGPDVRFGVVSDVDDTVMVTALPRPLLAAWNSFVVDEHARQPVPGMAVLMERLVRDRPGTPVDLPLDRRMEHRADAHPIPAPAPLPARVRCSSPTGARRTTAGSAAARTTSSPTSGALAAEFPHVKWLLIGDDGQHDDEIYTTFTSEYPGSVAAVAIRRLSPAEAVLAGGRTAVNDHKAATVPWVTESDGAGLARAPRRGRRPRA